MKKCPQCGADLKTLARFCEACGSEIPAEISPAAEIATAPTSIPGADVLCSAIENDLAVLSSCPPASGLAAFLAGLLTIPTLYLINLRARAIYIFFKDGLSPGRSRLGLEQNLRHAQLNYSGDSAVSAVVQKARDQLNDYIEKRHRAHKRFLLGVSVSVLMGVLVVVGVQVSRKIAADRVRAELAAQERQRQQEAEKAARKRQEAEQALAAAQQKAAGQSRIRAAVTRGAFNANTAYTAAVIVENHASADLDSRIVTLQDHLSSLIRNKQFTVLSQEVIKPALAESSTVSTESALAVNDTALSLTQRVGADLLLYAAFNSFGSESRKWTGAGVTTENVIYTLRLTYRLVESREGGTLQGGTIVASKTIRQTDSLQISSDELMNELIADAAGQMAERINLPSQQSGTRRSGPGANSNQTL